MMQFCADHRLPRLFIGFVCIVCAWVTCGCTGSTKQDVVVYSALDQEFSQPILDQFEQQSGVHVRPLFDVEATKTVGLFNRLMQERARPQCDVFWNNEILHTIRLARAGVLDPYRPAAAEKWPDNFRGRKDLWIGFAARARVLIINTELVPEPQRPDSIMDLADPQWKGKAGIARPLFGTTATHAAVLFATWGNEKAERYFSDIQDNAVVVSGNKQVALAVANGQLAFGITDTDDAIIELERGRPVAIVFPDQGADQLGTLFIPNTLSIIRGAPRSQAARRLVEFLLSPEVERQLAEGPSAQFPVNPQLRDNVRIPGAGDVRWMDVDFEAAADAWEHSAKFLDSLFGSGVAENP